MNSIRLSQLVGAVLPHCEETWMSEQSRSTVARVAARLPDVASSIGFELRLTGADSQVDLGVALRRSPEVREAWGGFLAERPAGAGSREWSAVGAFLGEWLTGGSQLADWIPFIYWEVDANTRLAVPCVFASFDWPISGRVEWPDERRRMLAVAQRVLRLLLGPVRLATLSDSVTEAIASLPFGGRVVHIGAMLGRTDGAVRLSLSLPADAGQRYLNGLGIDAGWYMERFRAAVPGAPRMHLECDLTPRCASRVGFVINGTTAQDSAIEYVRSIAGGDDRKIAALRRWRAGTLLTSYAIASPVQLAVSHLKLDLDPCAALGLKAYLSATVRD